MTISILDIAIFFLALGASKSKQQALAAVLVTTRMSGSDPTNVLQHHQPRDLLVQEVKEEGAHPNNMEDSKTKQQIMDRQMMLLPARKNKTGLPQAAWWSWAQCFNPRADFQEGAVVVNSQSPHVPPGYIFLAGGGYECGAPPQVRHGTFRLGSRRRQQRFTTLLPVVNVYWAMDVKADRNSDPESCRPICALEGVDYNPQAFIDGKPVQPWYLCDKKRYRMGYCPPTEYTTQCDICAVPQNDTRGYCQGACDDPNQSCFGCQPTRFNNCKSNTNGRGIGTYFNGYWLVDHKRIWKVGDSHEFQISARPADDSFCAALIVNMTAVAFHS